MKIAIYNPYNFEKPGGVQDHIRAQAETLRRRGHDVTILTPRPRKYHGPPPPNTVFTGVSARLKAQGSMVDVSSTIDQSEIDELYSTHTFDVVHFHEPNVPFVARQLIASCPCPVVATLHAALPETVIGRSLGSITPYFRSILQHVDVLTRVSTAAGEYLGSVIEVVDTVIIPNGIELKKYKNKKRIKREPLTIVYIGRLEKRKGVKYLIDAAALLQQSMPALKVIIAGDGPERKRLEARVNKLGLRNAHFLGFVSDEQKKLLLKSSTIACFPAIYGESFGIVLLEAMASEIPVVAGNNPGYETVLTGRGSLGLVDPTDVIEFSRRLSLFLQDADLRKLLTAWGISNVRSFDYEVIVSKYEQVYKEVLRART